MTDAPQSLYNQALENKTEGIGIITGNITLSAPMKPTLKVDRRQETIELIRGKLEEAAKTLMEKPKEITKSITEMYGDRTIVAAGKIETWTADYTEFKYAKILSEKLSKTPHKLVTPLKTGTVGLASSEFDYYDSSTGKPLKEQKWITVADGFIPSLLASVEVKTNTYAGIREKTGKFKRTSAGKGRQHINAKYGDTFLEKSAGIVGYVHFIQEGTVELTAKQKSFLKKRGDFTTKGWGGDLIVKGNFDNFIDGLRRKIIAEYWIEQVNISFLSVAKINNAIRQALVRLGLVSGNPSEETSQNINIEKGFSTMVTIVSNYLKTFAEQGINKLENLKKTGKYPSSQIQWQYDQYAKMEKISSEAKVSEALSGKFIKNNQYREAINEVLAFYNIQYQFTVLDKGFSIGRFEPRNDFFSDVKLG